METALKLFLKHNNHQGEGFTWARRAVRAMLIPKPKEAIAAARRARELADDVRNERDIIQAEWLLGWALIDQNLSEAETHLSEALTSCRRINIVDHEPNISAGLGPLAPR